MVRLHSHKQHVVHRLKIVKGHLEKVLTMVQNDTYCIDILHQSLAIQKALKQIDRMMMEKHLQTCAVEQIKKGHEERMVKELLGIYGYKTS